MAEKASLPDVYKFMVGINEFPLEAPGRRESTSEVYHLNESDERLQAARTFLPPYR